MKIGITERGDGGLSFAKVKKAIDSKTVDGAIVITKVPSKLVREIEYFLEHKNILIHTTITGLGGTPLEPNVNTADYELDAYHTLSTYLPERVILRIDPVILDAPYLKMAKDVLIQAKTRVRISFLDFYPHVADRLRASGLNIRINEDLHYDLDTCKLVLESFQNILNSQGKNIKIEVCGEPGIECTGCISEKDIETMGLMRLMSKNDLSKGNQRPACQCLANKVELLNSKHPCKNGCLYCYWK